MLWLSGGAHLTPQLTFRITLLLIYPVRTQKLQVRDDVVDVVVGQRDEAAQWPLTKRILRVREVEEPLIMRDAIAERLGSVVVEVRRDVLDPQSVGILNWFAKKARGTANSGGTGGWLGKTNVGCKRSPTSGDCTVTTGFTPSLMIHVRIGLLGALT